MSSNLTRYTKKFCRDCSNKRSRKYYKENKEEHKKVVVERNKKVIAENRKKYFNLLNQCVCVGCGEDNLIVLEFDHKDGVKKIESVSRMVGNGYSWEAIEREIEKCDPRCANCHRIRTAEQQGWYKDLI